MHARPIYPAGRSTELNTFVGFRAIFRTPPAAALLTLAASTIYRVHVNGRFVAHGPAQCAHGHYRLDVHDLTPYLHADAPNVLVIEVAGYNVNSYYLLDQPAFLQAELVSAGQTLAATGDPTRPFTAFNLPHRIQKVQRFSFQRPFVEMYDLKPGSLDYLTDAAASVDELPIEVLPAKKTLARGVPYPVYATCQPSTHVASGTLKASPSSKSIYMDKSVAKISPILKGFPEPELPRVLSTLLQSYDPATRKAIETPYSGAAPIKLKARAYHTLDFGTNRTGFLGLTIRCTSPATIIADWDELLIDGHVTRRMNDCANAISFDLQPGTYTIESIEPYSFQYLRLLSLSGSAEITDVYLREYTHPDAFRVHFATSDDSINTIFAAARETFSQNVVDIFMDCPSRERAGWLCDSYYSAAVERALTGRSSVERAYLENFALPDHFDHLPAGMVPMCYPADHDNGSYIPQFAFWFVLQVEQYLARTADRALIDTLRPRVESIFADYFARYLNADGLLESLDGWKFIEWSKANDFQDGVNYPTNMLYAAALDVAGRLYNVPAYTKQAARIRRQILKQSFDGDFFVDNALRQNGKLVTTGERTEVCQYFAFSFDVATATSHPRLWKRLLTRFGPERAKSGALSEIHPANMIVGNYLRMRLLSRSGRSAQLLDEIRTFFLKMARTTGTLWEHSDTRASCNHGFASYVACLLLSDAVGLTLNPVDKTAALRVPANGLDWCGVRVPVGNDSIAIRWSRHSKTAPHIALPAGWTLQAAPSPKTARRPS